MKYLLISLLLTWLTLPAQAQQREKKITILPFRPPKSAAKRSTAPKKKKAAPAGKQEQLDRELMEKRDTVDDYLRRNSEPMLAPSSSSSSFSTTVPGFVAGERSRYQKGETPSTMQHVPFKFEPGDKFEQDARNRPVVPVGAGDVAPSGGAAISGDINGAIGKVFSKNARLRARNQAKRLWEKYPKVTPNDSLVKELNDKPKEMLSVRQQADSVALRKDSVLLRNRVVKPKKGVTRQQNRTVKP